MRNFKLLLAFSLAIFFNAAKAQTFVYALYDWDDKLPAFKPEKTDSSSEILIKDKVVFQANIENNTAYEYYLRHKQTFVNSPSAIERNNRVYLPSGLRGEVVKLKVRVIKPSGAVVEMNDSDIKEGTDEKGERKYKYLAVRGLEQGSIVEELFVTKMPSDFTGRNYYLQSDYPKRNCTFELVYPKFLVFDTKSYNGFPKLERDSSFIDEGMACLKASADYIPALKNEKYSNVTAYKQKVAFKLTGNTRSGNMNINSYDKISDILFRQVERELSKQEVKALDKTLKGAMLEYAKNEEDKIRKLEDYLKKLVYSSDELPNNSVTINDMLEKNIADESSLTRLYIAALNKLGIEYQLVVGCDHTDLTFEKNFESLSYLDKYFLYFPKYNKYLAPAFPLYRYGMMPYQYRNNYALFIKKTSFGNLTTGLGSVRFLEPDNYLDNTDSLIINVNFDKGPDNAVYNYRVTNSGHEATAFQTLIEYVKEEKDKEQLRKSLIKNFSDEEDIKNLKAENEGPEFFAKKPYAVSASFSSGKYLDKAGAKYIFKIGELIGPQEQLYQEEARKLPVEMNYCKNYFREITFKIPAGYRLINAERLNMDIFQKDKDGNRSSAFRSWYTIKDDVVTVLVEEYYKKISLPVEEYEAFKSVINASADFNKISLLLEPKP